MKRALAIGAPAGLAVLAGILWLVHGVRPASEPTQPGTSEPAAASEPASSPALALPLAPPAAVDPAPARAATRIKEADAKRLRDAILAAIGAARADAGAARSKSPASPAPPAEERELSTLDRRYIRSAVREIAPMLGECFDLARHEQPELRAARVVVHFSIIGDQQLGGVIEESRIGDESTGMTPPLAECVRETMYDLKLPAPEGQGRVEVTYPFEMRATDAEPAARP